MKKIIILFVIVLFAVGFGGDLAETLPAGGNAISPVNSGGSSSISAVTCPSEPQDCGDECPPPIPSAIASC